MEAATVFSFCFFRSSSFRVLHLSFIFSLLAFRTWLTSGDSDDGDVTSAPEQPKATSKFSHDSPTPKRLVTWILIHFHTRSVLFFNYFFNIGNMTNIFSQQNLVIMNIFIILSTVFWWFIIYIYINRLIQTQNTEIRCWLVFCKALWEISRALHFRIVDSDIPVKAGQTQYSAPIQKQQLLKINVSFCLVTVLGLSGFFLIQFQCLNLKIYFSDLQLKKIQCFFQIYNMQFLV